MGCLLSCKSTKLSSKNYPTVHVRSHSKQHWDMILESLEGDIVDNPLNALDDSIKTMIPKQNFLNLKSHISPS